MVSVPAGTFLWQRGNISKNMGLRLQIQIPDGVVGKGSGNKGRQLTVSDIVDTSNNQNMLYGAQFADYITMTVKGVGIPGGRPADPLACPGQEASQVHELVALGIDSAKSCDASSNVPRARTRW
jgi:hypothetical protein